LYSALTSDTALIDELGGETAVYYGVAPQGTARPYVIFFNAGGGPENTYPGDLTSERYVIKGVSDTLGKALDVDARCRAAIHKQTLTVTGYTNIWTRREAEVSLTEVSDDGTVIRHEGGYYRIRVDA
jgi:hypothetical protein